MPTALIQHLIEKYAAESPGYLSVEYYIQALANIGEQLVLPSEIRPEDLMKLERVLGNLLRLLKKQNHSSTDIEAVKRLIAEVSYLAAKSIQRRTHDNNMALLSLGERLMELKYIL